MEVVITNEGMKMVPKKKPDQQAELGERKRPEETVPSLEDILANLDAEEEDDDEVIDVPSMSSLLAGLDEEETGGSAASTGAPSTADHGGNLEETEVLDSAGDDSAAGALPVVTRKAYLAKLASTGKSEESAPQPEVQETALAVIPSVETFLQRLERDAKIAAEEEAEQQKRQMSEDVREQLGQAVVEAPSLARTAEKKKPLAPRRNEDAVASDRPPSGPFTGLFRETPNSGGLHVSRGRAAFGESSRPINLRGRGRGKGIGRTPGYPSRS